MTVATTYTILLIAQALHLLHHRLAKRHISFVECVAGGVLCVPLNLLPAAALMTVHLGLVAIQIVGSVNITRFSPDWDRPKAPPRA